MRANFTPLRQLSRSRVWFIYDFLRHACNSLINNVLVIATVKALIRTIFYDYTFYVAYIFVGGWKSASVQSCPSTQEDVDKQLTTRRLTRRLKLLQCKFHFEAEGMPVSFSTPNTKVVLFDVYLKHLVASSTEDDLYESAQLEWPNFK